MANIKINEHITHTNNTLIFGEINGSVNQGIPSLKSALRGEDNFGKIIKEIGEDGNNRLLVYDNSDVTQIFKPTYYFWTTKESVDGKIKIVVHHDAKYREDAIPVQISRDSLCFRLLASGGNIKIDDLIQEIRGDLKRGLDSYIKTIGVTNSKRKEKQEKIRKDLISKLTEPVVIYLLLAHSSQNYKIIDGILKSDPNDAEVKTIDVLLPDFSNEGDWAIKIEKIKVQTNTKINILDEDEEKKVISELDFKSDIRQGKQYIAAVAKSYLEDIPTDASPSDEKQKLIEALVQSGVAEQLKQDHLTECKTARTNNLLESEKSRYLAENKDLQLEALKSEQQDDNNALKPQEPPKTDLAQNYDTSLQMLSNSLRDKAVESGKLLDHINIIKQYTNQYYGQEADKHRKISTFLHTLTPVGKIENKFETVNKQAGGKKDLNGTEGFSLYLDLCLEEAANQSNLIHELAKTNQSNILKNALLLKQHPINAENEETWKQFSDDILQTARATFEDYMAKVVPVASQLIGIDTFLKTSNSAIKSKPRVLIANTNIDDILGNEDELKQFEKFLEALNDRATDEFERAISIIIVPKLPEEHKETLFELGYRHNFCAFVTPEDPIEYNELNEAGKLSQIAAEWSSNTDESFSSGVLCVPDNVMIPGPFTFEIGRYLTSNRACQCEIDEPVVLPSCYDAAGLVARNDDAVFVKKYIDNNLKIKPEWPCIGMAFDSKKPEHTSLWKSEAYSDGAIFYDVLTGNPPLCIFEHRTDAKGKLVKQRIRHLNTLYVMPDDEAEDRPVPVHEVRIGQYLQKALTKNYPGGASAQALNNFAKDLAGISNKQFTNSIIDPEKYKLEFNKDTERFDLKFKDQDRIIFKFAFSPAGSAEDSK